LLEKTDPVAKSSKSLLVPEATRLLTRFNLFTREFESSRPDFRATGATVTVAFGPQNLACGIESAGAGGRKILMRLSNFEFGDAN
jgi:hypothetical protein